MNLLPSKSENLSRFTQVIHFCKELSVAVD